MDKAELKNRILGAFSNCGGTNLRGSRYAGRLAREADALTMTEILGIGHSLIFQNGVRKTTAPQRNAPLFDRVLSHGVLGAARPIRVLDVGASFGINAISTRERLARDYTVSEYVLGDLFTRIFVDDARGLVFDEDGALLQVRLPIGFVATNFSFNYSFQRVLTLPQRVLPALMRRRYRFDRTTALREIPLVHPALHAGEGDSPFRQMRMNVFEPPRGETFDFIVCMHLLVDRYFDEATRMRGRQALTSMLRPGGALVVGAADDFTVIGKSNDGSTRVVRV